MDRAGTGFLVIPKEIISDKNLKSNEKMLLTEIKNLSQKDGYCFARNRFFAEKFNVTTRTIQRWIANLVEKGYLKLELIKNKYNEVKRKLYFNLNLKNNSEKLEEKENKKIEIKEKKSMLLKSLLLELYKKSKKEEKKEKINNSNHNFFFNDKDVNIGKNILSPTTKMSFNNIYNNNIYNNNKNKINNKVNIDNNNNIRK